ncbi:hypothetical protein [Propioniciclava sp. MC1595]|uniref:hypothetical protein n=1 Tax=Propioniciclava sp. MC1595 TaxID=2760308 RepID=UPI0035CCE215
MFFATSNDLVYQFDYLGDPDRLVIDFSDSHIWDASTVAALDAVRHQVRQARQVRGDRGRERVVRRPPRAALRPPRRDGRMTRPRPASRAGPACHGDAEDRLEQRVGVGAHGRRLGTGVEPALHVGGGDRGQGQVVERCEPALVDVEVVLLGAVLQGAPADQPFVDPFPGKPVEGDRFGLGQLAAHGRRRPLASLDQPQFLA